MSSSNYPKLNSRLKSILYNRWILYFISFLAIVDFIYLCGVSDWVSVVVFASVGFLVTFFNKNMIVVFSIAMVVTHLLKYGIHGARITRMSEGFEDGDENVLSGDSEELKKIENEEKPLLPAEVPVKKEEKHHKENKKVEKKDDKKEEVKSKMSKLMELKKEFPEFKEIQKEIKSSFDKINPLLSKAENFIEKFNDYKSG